MADIAVSFLLEKLSGQFLQEYNLPSDVKQNIKLLQNQMETLNALLKDSKQKLNNDQLLEAVHEAEDVIDTYICNLNRQRIKRWWDLTNYGEVQSMMETKMDTEVVLKDRRRNVEKDDVVGFNVYSDAMIERLRGGHKERKVVSIIGTGGQGKTTLARKIYQNNQLKRCFDKFAWVDVLEDWKIEAILLFLLAQVGSSSYHGIGIENLRQAIQKELDDGYFQNMSTENLLKKKNP
ncbi:putative disease resistance protein At1g58400 [Prosopis cineraria]|uniref:putative disease resistance protein At1g58400 n=1 Tax=Prosopis cineraria TaxID=364024 RepID=UPI00240F0C6F|nr:putative disease resistance protein At1g58400 [Prosopis cineraria]